MKYNKAKDFDIPATDFRTYAGDGATNHLMSNAGSNEAVPAPAVPQNSNKQKGIAKEWSSGNNVEITSDANNPKSLAEIQAGNHQAKKVK